MRIIITGLQVGNTCGWHHLVVCQSIFCISPSRYIHTGEAETYRPIAEIVAELDTIEAEARETDTALRKILEQIGV